MAGRDKNGRWFLKCVRVHGSFDVHIAAAGGRATAGGLGELSKVSSGARLKGNRSRATRASENLVEISTEHSRGASDC